MWPSRSSSWSDLGRDALYFICQAFGVARSYDRLLRLLFNPHDTRTDHAPVVRSTQSTNPIPYIATCKISQHSTLTASRGTFAPPIWRRSICGKPAFFSCSWSAFFFFSLMPAWFPQVVGYSVRNKIPPTPPCFEAFMPPASGYFNRKNKPLESCGKSLPFSVVS